MKPEYPHGIEIFILLAILIIASIITGIYKLINYFIDKSKPLNRKEVNKE